MDQRGSRCGGATLFSLFWFGFPHKFIGRPGSMFLQTSAETNGVSDSAGLVTTPAQHLMRTFLGRFLRLVHLIPLAFPIPSWYKVGKGEHQ